MKATDLLRMQHRELQHLFEKVLKSDDVRMRKTLTSEIRSMLDCHMMIEEETFYPAYRKAAKTRNGDSLVLAAFEEHHVLDLLLSELPKVDPAVESFGPKMKVLEELILHHVQEEEQEMFPDAEKKFAATTLEELGIEMEIRADEWAR